MSLIFLFLARVPIGQVLHVSFQKFELSFKIYVQNCITRNVQLSALVFFFEADGKCGKKGHVLDF